ncbi:MAG TPA: hypothetical protein VMA53_22340 [Stellaceae bacterium]|nr:hypothetical protein [Stellaceae bacterium]
MDGFANEQRLVYRVFRHWTTWSAARRFPSKDDIDVALLGDDAENCVLVQLAAEIDQSVFVAVGEHLLPHGAALDGRPIAGCPKGTLLATMLKYLPRFRPDGGPLSIAGSATHLDEPVLFRGILLPLADDGTSIDHILGAANFRTLRRGEEKQLRTRLEVLMLRVEPGQIWDVYSPLSGGWVQAKVAAVDGDQAKLRQKETMVTLSLKPSEMMRHPERYRFVSYTETP